MSNSNLTHDIDFSNIQPILLPLEDADTSIKSPFFTIVPNLNRVIRIFIENSMNEAIKTHNELLDIIKRYSELIEKNFISPEELCPELIYLSKVYKFRNPSKVLKFLSDNISLIPLVAEAYEKIRKYFSHTEAVLEVITDPEDASEELVIFICTDLSPDEVFKKLEQFDKDWWLDASYEAGEKLCIHVEFKEDLIGQNI